MIIVNRHPRLTSSEGARDVWQVGAAETKTKALTGGVPLLPSSHLQFSLHAENCRIFLHMATILEKSFAQQENRMIFLHIATILELTLRQKLAAMPANAGDATLHLP